MNKTILSLLIVFLALPVFGREVSGVSMPEEIKVGTSDLALNGMGVRRVQYIMKAYVAGLYLDKSLKPPVKDTNTILDSKTTKRLDIQFTMYVPGSSMRDALEKGVPKNCQGECNFTKEMDTLKSWLQNFKKGDKIEMVFNPTNMELKFNGEVKGKIEGEKFSRTLLAVFIGVPPDEDLKKGLLGN